MSAGRALLFDVGNSRLKWGIYEDGRIARSGSVSHETLRDSGFGTLTNRLPRQVDRALASNVAGATFATRLSGVIGLHCDVELRFARTRKEAYGVVVAYAQPRTLGVDRWLALIAARGECRGACCVVDAGTALTIDLLDRTGRHLGGQIIPGIDMMAASLSEETADIAVSGRRGKAREGLAGFADNTNAAVMSGAHNAVCAAIDRAMRQARAGGLRPKLVLTGGDASRILGHLDSAAVHRPHLVLQGLARIIDSES